MLASYSQSAATTNQDICFHPTLSLTFKEAVEEATISGAVMEKEEQKWDQELEEEEKEEDSLKVRRSRAPNGGTPTESSAVEEDATQLNSSSSKTNGQIVHPSESVTDNVVEESILDQTEKQVSPEIVVAPLDNGVRKETEITEGDFKSNGCVYYDKDEEHIEKNYADNALGTRSANIGAEKNLNSVIDYQHEGIQKNVNLSDHHYSEILPEECTSSSKTTEIEPADIGLVDESDVEGADLDVERVLQKQKTHDLYCPNCNSCITRRVILRKRKRRVRITSEDAKRNKLEMLTASTAKDSYHPATSDQGYGNIHVDGTSELATNDYERQREPDIFRCLSCFSIFIPTGKGFKLFKIFGDRGKKNTIEDQQISSSFLPHKDRTTAGSGIYSKGDAPKTSPRADMASSNLNNLNRTSEVQGDGEKASNLNDINRTSEVQGDGDKASNLNDLNQKSEAQIDGDKALPSSVQEQLMHDKVMPDAGNDAKNNFEAVSGNQLNMSNGSKDATYVQGDQSVAVSTNRSPVSKGEPQKDSTSVCLPDGLKFLISANVDSITQQKLQKDQNPEMKVHKMGADMESILSMPPKTSEHVEMDMNRNTTTQVKISPENEQHVGAMVPNLSAYENGTLDKPSSRDGASSYELPQQKIHDNKVEIHAGDHLKINKDTLVLSVRGPTTVQEKQADSIKDLKKVTIEHSTGKDTVIVVEAGPGQTAPSQLLPDSNASAELGTSAHLASNIDVVDRMGANAGEAYEIEIIKSIVYGGLVESITSLGIVSSAAGGGTATLNILALAVANLIAGLVLVGHNLWELKEYYVVEAPNRITDSEQIDRYKELLGRRENFAVHATVAVLSFIVFGLISPITYAFSFQKSDDRDFKLLAAGAASLLCIVLLATGKAYIQRPTTSYLKTIGYHVILGFTASGISFAAGEIFKRFLDKFHVLQSGSPAVGLFTQTRPEASLWASN